MFCALQAALVLSKKVMNHHLRKDLQEVSTSTQPIRNNFIPDHYKTKEDPKSQRTTLVLVARPSCS